MYTPPSSPQRKRPKSWRGTPVRRWPWSARPWGWAAAGWVPFTRVW